ncbi:hypothetical protein HB904_04440 [Listeria booriae]|uniref:Uncharacterized protein n=1 Tax=Listeria booriae TaxID=1552123 RepID=A0A842AFT6_9LIST|nr:hypothetical protein [Listeria booriae]MBC1615422.1 hypothetical protein [Listeria booriae]
MPKLTISKELDAKITKALDDLTLGFSPHLDKIYAVSGELSNSDLDANGLTAKDIFDLATGNYSVKKQYEVGRYYRSSNSIFKVTSINEDMVYCKIFYEDENVLLGDDYFQYGSYRDREARPAKNREVKILNRAEQFYKQGRQLNEFKQGDVVRRTQGEPFYFREVHKGEESTLTLVCTKEKRGDL